jgi:hypothetical protein
VITRGVTVSAIKGKPKKGQAIATFTITNTGTRRPFSASRE